MDSASQGSPASEEIIRGCIKKDKRAWEIFVERYSKVVYWAIRDRIRRSGYSFEEEDVNDIHQDVFITLWAGDKFTQLKDRSKVAGWLAMIAGNAAVDHFRKMKRQSPPNSISIYEEIYSDGEGGGKTLEELLPAAGTDPARPLQLDEIRRVVEKEVGALKPKDKMMIKLDIFHGMKHREIAEALKMPLEAVSTTIRRTKEGLRQKLRDKI